MNKSLFGWAAALTLAGVITTACNEPAREVLAQHPLEHIDLYSSRETFITLAPGVALAEIVNLEPFEEAEVWPGMNLTEAEAVFGHPPDSTMPTHSRETTYSFSTRHGLIQIIHQVVQSEGPPVDRWFLRWKPGEDADFLFDTSILEQLPEDRRSDHSLIFKDSRPNSPGTFEQAKVVLGPSGEVRYVWWYSKVPDEVSKDESGARQPGSP
jgi:hypothetical protein